MIQNDGFNRLENAYLKWSENISSVSDLGKEAVQVIDNAKWERLW